jgi:hypothetical protein
MFLQNFKAMKHGVFLALLLALSCSLIAQKLTISEPIPMRSDLTFDILGEMRGRTLLFRNQNGNAFKIQAFDQDMHKDWSKELELDRRSPKIIEVAPLDTVFTVLYHYKDRSNTILKAHKYGPGANLLDSTTIMNLGLIFYTPNFEVVHSEDRSKSLIFYSEKQDIIKVLCFDHQRMEMLWQTIVKPMDFNYFQNFRHMVVNNRGDMFMVLERNNYRSKREEHQFEIYAYGVASKRLRTIRVPMPEKLTFDASFIYDHLNGHLTATGLYSDKNLGRADGFFFFKMDVKSTEGFLLAMQPFEASFITNLLGKKADKAKGVPEAEVRDVVLRRDGGVLLIGERTRGFQRNAGNVNQTFYNMGGGRFAVDFYYDEIFVISIHPDGTKHWSTVMHKKQFSQDDDGVYSSFFLLRSASTLHFLFNDEIKYENTVSEYILKGNGKFKRKSLMSTENLKLRLRFRNAVQVGVDTLIIPSERRNRLKLVRMVYD